MSETRWDAEIVLPDARSDRAPSAMHRLENAAASGLFGWSRRAGIERASDRMGALARRLGPRLPAHKVGLRNLALTMPERADEHAAILSDAWDNLGRTAAEYAHLDEVAVRTQVVGAEHLEAVRANGPAIFVSGHMANWEAMPIILHRSGLRTAIIFRAANNPLVDRTIIDERARVMTRHQIPKGRRGGRALMAALKDGISLCMLTDQKLSDGIEVPFLGVPAMTAPAAARLALRENLPVIPLQAVREPGSSFTVTIHPPLRIEPTGVQAHDAYALTLAINEAVGGFIREHPGQWLWFHRRWKGEGGEGGEGGARSQDGGPS